MEWSNATALFPYESASNVSHVVVESFFTASSIVTIGTPSINGHADVMIHSTMTRWQQASGSCGVLVD
jgi:hypothetical protein